MFFFKVSIIISIPATIYELFTVYEVVIYIVIFLNLTTPLRRLSLAPF